MKYRYWIALIVIALVAVSVAAAQNAPEEVERLTVEILSVRDHDPQAFTQGLLLYDEFLYESTGRYGQSTLRRVDPDSGEILAGVRLNQQIFGEGLALVDERLIQITWRAGLALVFERETFELLGVFEYEGEGWGLCYDGESIYMSDGSANLFMRDPSTFELIDTIPVTLEDEPIDQINELECVEDAVYANVWHSENILRIDKESGSVTGVIDASTLLTDEQRTLLNEEQAVLNGIAYDADNDVFLLTGKLWPWLFEVRFAPED